MPFGTMKYYVAMNEQRYVHKHTHIFHFEMEKPTWARSFCLRRSRHNRGCRSRHENSGSWAGIWTDRRQSWRCNVERTWNWQPESIPDHRFLSNLQITKSPESNHGHSARNTTPSCRNRSEYPWRRHLTTSWVIDLEWNDFGHHATKVGDTRQMPRKTRRRQSQNHPVKEKGLHRMKKKSKNNRVVVNPLTVNYWVTRQ